MVKLNKIYTRTGDDGTTGLVRGPRRPKNNIRVKSYGDVDEANAQLGLVRLHTAGMPKLDSVLARIQNDLFDLGSDLATPPGDEDSGKDLRITPAQTDWIETQIDFFNEKLEPLQSFVLPGGTPQAAALHVARTVVRRAEREVVALIEAEPETSPETARYLNRLSDLLFVLARSANANGSRDVLWKPGQYAN